MNKTDTGVYFSINGGTTNLKAFNSNSSGDLQDWASGTNDAFNAFSNSGVLNDMSAVDFQVMDVIGYDFAGVPEPSSASAIFAAALGAVATLSRRCADARR